MSEELQTKINEVTERYKRELQRIEEEGRALGDQAMDPNTGEAMNNIDFDIEWKEREIIFDVPTVTMRDRDLSLDLPRIEMKRQRIVFHTPSVRMEDRVVGKYPVFRGIKVTMKDIIMKVPVHFMEKQEIIFDIPEVRMERKNISLKIPEFGKNRQRWVVRLPEFTARSIKVEAKRLQERGQDLQRRGEDIGERMQAEVQLLVASFYGPLAEEGRELRQDVEESFTGAIQQVKSAIDELSARKIDPIKVPAEGGDINLRKMMTDLVATREMVTGEIETALAIPEETPELIPG